MSFPLFVMLAIAKHVRQIIHHRVLECIKFVFSTSPDDPPAGLKGLLLRIRGGERRAEGEGRDGGKGRDGPVTQIFGTASGIVTVDLICS